MSYTTTSTTPDDCPNCGRPLVEAHGIEYVQGENVRVPVGAARTCRGSQADSWLLRSRMPTTARARDVARRNVL